MLPTLKPGSFSSLKLTCPSPGDLADPGIELMRLMSPALASGFFTPSAAWEAHLMRVDASFYFFYVMLFVFVHARSLLLRCSPLVAESRAFSLALLGRLPSAGPPCGLGCEGSVPDAPGL